MSSVDNCRKQRTDGSRQAVIAQVSISHGVPNNWLLIATPCVCVVVLVRDGNRIISTIPHQTPSPTYKQRPGINPIQAITIRLEYSYFFFFIVCFIHRQLRLQDKFLILFFSTLKLTGCISPDYMSKYHVKISHDKNITSQYITKFIYYDMEKKLPQPFLNFQNFHRLHNAGNRC